MPIERLVDTQVGEVEHVSIGLFVVETSLDEIVIDQDPLVVILAHQCKVVSLVFGDSLVAHDAADDVVLLDDGYRVRNGHRRCDLGAGVPETLEVNHQIGRKATDGLLLGGRLW